MRDRHAEPDQSGILTQSVTIRSTEEHVAYVPLGSEGRICRVVDGLATPLGVVNIRRIGHSGLGNRGPSSSDVLWRSRSSSRCHLVAETTPLANPRQDARARRVAVGAHPSGRDPPAYAELSALTMGWPIATGVIEGACLYLVKDRLAITGARWSLPGAEAVLLLRAVITNGYFNAYWKFHLQQEHQRTHTSRYRHQFERAA